MLAQHDPLDLRHLLLAKSHRRRHGEGGRQQWFFITADYAFGHAAAEATTATMVEANGGKVMGSVTRSPATTDFSSFLLQAQSSGAKVIGPRQCRRATP